MANEIPASGIPHEASAIEVIDSIAKVADTTSNIRTIIKLGGTLISTLGIILSLFKGCSFLPSLPKIAPTKITNIDTTKTITTTATSVTYTPLATTTNPKPRAITIKKAIEAKVLFNNGQVTITHFGFCMEPFVGYTLTIADGLRPYLAGRFIYLDDLGIQAGINDRRGFLGIDWRLPKPVNLVTFAGGESISFTGNLDLYIALAIQIGLF